MTTGWTQGGPLAGVASPRRRSPSLGGSFHGNPVALCCLSKAKLCGTSGPPVPSSGVWVVTHGLPSRRKRAPPGRSPSSFCALIVQQPELLPGLIRRKRTPFVTRMAAYPFTNFRKQCIFKRWDVLKRGNLYANLRVCKSLKVLSSNTKMSSAALLEKE